MNASIDGPAKGTNEPPYWSLPPEALLATLSSTALGLSTTAADAQRARFGPNTLEARQKHGGLRLLLNQFRSPLVLILIVAAIISAVVREWVDAAIVLAVVLGSTLLGFFQEFRATGAVERLRSQVALKSTVLRDGKPVVAPSDTLVPGDVVLLSAGSLIPADGVLLEAVDFSVNQAVLTGETFPVERAAGLVPPEAALGERTNCVFMGTNVRSGTARAVIARTGKSTVFGGVADRLRLRPAENEFERGIQRFGYLLTRVMLVMVIIVLAINMLLAKPAIDSLLFALALAVGLTPELLPAIISITLAHGAQKMAKRGVIVRRLNAISNFGSMDVLCTDKTGTLTEGVVRIAGAEDPQGQPSEAAFQLAYLNARWQTGLSNPLDEAILEHGRSLGLEILAASRPKIAEIPYDFTRRRLSVVVGEAGGGRTIVTKGAVRQMLGLCTKVVTPSGVQPLDAAMRADVERRVEAWGAEGTRVLAIGSRALDDGEGGTPESAGRPPGGLAVQRMSCSERDLTLAGFLLFSDPPKADVPAVVAALSACGVRLVMVTGDSHAVALHVAQAVGLAISDTLTGPQLDALHEEALWQRIPRTTVFAEVEPAQKERIIQALRKTGHVVGYMGDGINDAPALHAADVGISVDTAVDVAKDAADFVLLSKDLGVLREGIDEGRRTFANTLKYILTTISANFGNMFSMAFATLFLPFLPLLASQILLNNFLSDVPGMTLAGDNVDAEMMSSPRRWDTRFIRDYMVLFGCVSSLFDFLTFGALLYVFRTGEAEFQTAWFVESLLTELVIALVVRTRGLFWRSRPGRMLLLSTLAVLGLTLCLPYIPAARIFGFVPLPVPLLLSMLGLTGLYVVVTEGAKHFFYGVWARWRGTGLPTTVP